jgi:ribulokinase
MAYVIGIDGGTESVRAFVFDLEGRPKGIGVVSYPTAFPEPAQAEQNPDDWWRALGEATQQALQAASVTPDEIDAISVDTTSCSVATFDHEMKPLRPTLIWMDVRAADEAADVAATGDPALRLNSAGKGPVSAEWMIPKALWIKRHQPAIYAKAQTICEYQDYINYRLTGRYVGCLNNVSIRWHWINREKPASLLSHLGLEDLAGKWPEEIVAPGDPIAELTREAATHLGLKPGTPVIQGGADGFIAIIGLGVTEPGQLGLITGSSHLQLAVTDRVFHRPGLWGAYADCVYQGSAVLEGGQTSTGSVIKWFTSNFVAGTDYSELNRAAADIPPGADGLLALDHFQGNRTPYIDPKSRGALVGLSLAHRPPHVFRAIIEGICFGTEAVLRVFQNEDFRIKEAVVCGGAVRSPLWLQIHADVSGIPLTITELPDASVLGSGILAAYGAGHFKSIPEACSAMVHRSSVVEPNQKNHAVYRELFAGYEKLYSATVDVRSAIGVGKGR